MRQTKERRIEQRTTTTLAAYGHLEILSRPAIFSDVPWVVSASLFAFRVGLRSPQAYALRRLNKVGTSNSVPFKVPRSVALFARTQVGKDSVRKAGPCHALRPGAISAQTAARYRQASIPHRSAGRDCTDRNWASPPFRAAARSSPRASTCARPAPSRGTPWWRRHARGGVRAAAPRPIRPYARRDRAPGRRCRSRPAALASRVPQLRRAQKPRSRGRTGRV